MEDEHNLLETRRQSGEPMQCPTCQVGFARDWLIHGRPALKMIGGKGVPKVRHAPVLARESHWYRAPVGGVFRCFVPIGAAVSRGDVMGAISDPFGEAEREVICDGRGIVIGRSNMPTVYEGDALFHVADTPRADHAAEGVNAHMEAAPLYDEDEII